VRLHRAPLLAALAFALGLVAPAVAAPTTPLARADAAFENDPFTERLDGTEQLDADSAREIAALYAVDGHFWMSEIAVPAPGDTRGESGETFSVAYATDLDPKFTIHCTLYSHCPEEGQVIHIPAGFMPEDGYTHGGEGHVVVINVAEGREDGLYHLNEVVPAVGGPLNIGYGGPCFFNAFRNGGTCSEAATAGNIPIGGMLLRADELIAASAARGDLGHVLYVTTCVSKGHERWPATSGNGNGNAACPPMGSRIVLRKTDAQIAALRVPEWARVIFRTLAHYGMMSDDNNNYTVWTFGTEDDNGRTSLGMPAQWPAAIALMRKDADTFNVDLSVSHGSYHIHIPYDTLKQSDMAVLARLPRH